MLKEYFHIRLGPATQIAVPLEFTTEALSELRRNVCPLPGVPSHLLGVMNQRGRLLWIADLAAMLGVDAQKRWGEFETLTILALKGIERSAADLTELPQVGCVVTELKGTISIDSSQIKPIPPKTPDQMRPYLRGIATIGGTSISVLDPTPLFQALQSSTSSQPLVIK